MKRLIGIFGVALCVLAFGVAAAGAQEWTWSAPVPSTPVVTEITASQTSETVYGIFEGGVATLTAGGEVPGMTSTLEDSTAVLDLVTGYKDVVYVVTETKVKAFDGTNYTDLSLQPTLPTEVIEEADPTIIPGSYKYITTGNGGKLYVIYETVTGEEGEEVVQQYLLVGTPPAVTEGVTIKFSPATLNIGAKGNWVTCAINLPEGYNEADVDAGTVKITNISIQGVADKAVEIFKAPGAPSGVVYGAFQVKFVRDDKKNPGSDQSLSWHLRDMLSGQGRGKYTTVLTIAGQLTTGDTFQGTATFQAMKVK